MYCSRRKDEAISTDFLNRTAKKWEEIYTALPVCKADQLQYNQHQK